MKCQLCKQDEAIWAWQPFGPDESPLSFATVGSHYRGYALIKVCDFCKCEKIENAAESKTLIRFTLKDVEYVFDGTHDPYAPHLWDGGTSADPDGMTYTMLCRYTPSGHDIVAQVYDDVLAKAIIDSYNKTRPIVL